MDLSGLLLTVMVAIVVEALTEYAKAVICLFSRKEYKTAITQLAAMVCSVVLCILTEADLFAVVGTVFVYPWVGWVLTGIFASRGSNYLNDLISRLRNTVKDE